MTYSNIAKYLTELYSIRNDISNEIYQTEKEWHEAHKRLNRCHIKLKRLHLKMRELDHAIRVNNAMLIPRDDLPINEHELIDNPSYKFDYGNKVYLTEDEKTIIDYLRKHKIATAGDIYLGAKSFKSRFNKPVDLTPILERLIKKGELERIPTKKGMKVKLPNA